MAGHGKVGEALAAYRQRRRRPGRLVPGVYLLDGAGKPVALTMQEHRRRLHRKEAAHDKPYRTGGRQGAEP